jgi:hypothetical protein
MLHPVRVLLVALTWATALIPTMPARAETEVDLALVLESCLIPGFDGAFLSPEWRTAMATPRTIANPVCMVTQIEPQEPLLPSRRCPE